jgi:hypothetical protein
MSLLTACLFDHSVLLYIYSELSSKLSSTLGRVGVLIHKISKCSWSLSRLVFLSMSSGAIRGYHVQMSTNIDRESGTAHLAKHSFCFSPSRSCLLSKVEQQVEQISGTPVGVVQASPRTGASSAPFSTIPETSLLAPRQPSSSNQLAVPLAPGGRGSYSYSSSSSPRPRSVSGETRQAMIDSPVSSPTTWGSRRTSESDAMGTPRGRARTRKNSLSDASVALAKEKARTAQKENDSMVYLDGPQVYTCAQCRTHLTSHDDIISKSFHGRHGKCGFRPPSFRIPQGRRQ